MTRLTHTPAPAIAAVYASVKLLNQIMQNQGAGVQLGSKPA